MSIAALQQNLAIMSMPGPDIYAQVTHVAEEIAATI
jgi:hypothetical protein